MIVAVGIHHKPYFQIVALTHSSIMFEMCVCVCIYIFSPTNVQFPMILSPSMCACTIFAVEPGVAQTHWLRASGRSLTLLQCSLHRLDYYLPRYSQKTLTFAPAFHLIPRGCPSSHTALCHLMPCRSDLRLLFLALCCRL